MRYAIYFSPAEDDPLTSYANAWLGYNAFTGSKVPHCNALEMAGDELAYLTAPARRYGFHGTIIAPFRLAGGIAEPDLLYGFMKFCDSENAFDIGRFEIAEIDSFLALVPQQRSLQLDELERRAVEYFNSFREPPTKEEIESRNPDFLTVRQYMNLTAWGYPFVMEDFRFHMTLTGRIPTEDRARVAMALARHFSPVINRPVPFVQLALFKEIEADGPFAVLETHELRPVGARFHSVGQHPVNPHSLLMEE